MIVHIRKYQAYGTKHYPTREGVTLKAHWIQWLFGRRKCVPSTQWDFHPLKESGLDIVTEDYKSFKFIRTRLGKDGLTYSASIVLTDTQWKTANQIYDKISTVVVDSVYSTIDFLSAYCSDGDELPPQTLPNSLDTSLGIHYLEDVFVQSLKQCIIFSYGLHEPYEMAEEKWGNRVEDFNNFVVNLSPSEMVCSFNEYLQQEEPFLSMKPAAYLTEMLLKKLNLKNAIVKIRDEMCPKDCFEYFNYE